MNFTVVACRHELRTLLGSMQKAIVRYILTLAVFAGGLLLWKPERSVTTHVVGSLLLVILGATAIVVAERALRNSEDA